MTTRTNAASGVVTTYNWTDFNRLASIETTDNSKSQSHDFWVNGFRRKKTDKNAVETTEYAPGLATAVAKSQASTVTYLMGHHLLGMETGGSMFFYLADGLTTNRHLVDVTGTIRASYEFSEHGERIATSENGVSSQKTYVGGLSVQDEVGETGLMMMGHRFYEPTGQNGGIGRFLNRDPIGFAGGLNVYGYTGGANSPVTLTDHNGLTSMSSVMWAFGKGLVTGALGAALALGLIYVGGIVGIAIVTTLAVAGGGIFLADLIKRLLTGEGYTPEEAAGILGTFVGGGITARGFSRSRFSETRTQSMQVSCRPTSGTVWDFISRPGPNNPGTGIPKHFEMNTPSGMYFVHPNATKHMPEYLLNAGARHPNLMGMQEQALLAEFHQAVSLIAESEGLVYGTLQYSGPWEIIIGSPRNGPLPVVYHAVRR